MTLANDLYNFAYQKYGEKNERVGQHAFPAIKNLYEAKGATIKNVLVPFTDGKMQIGVAANLEKSVETGGTELIRAMEKSITLAIIDQNWKEHLREMDDLKQSVQNAVYEQKDPILIYKFESFELFKRFLAKVNEETTSFLTKADLPMQQGDQGVQAAQNVRHRQREKLQESKEDLSAGRGPRSAATNRNRPPEPVKPAASARIAGRNDRVNVQYSDGSVKKNVKV